MEIILRTRVILYPPEFYDYKEGIFDETQANPVWKKVGHDASEIYKVIQYNKEKCLIKDVWGDTYLIGEPFEDVFKKWSDNKGDRTEVLLEETSDEDASEDDDDNLGED
jgi:hypothetical protein